MIIIYFLLLPVKLIPARIYLTYLPLACVLTKSGYFVFRIEENIFTDRVSFRISELKCELKGRKTDFQWNPLQTLHIMHITLKINESVPLL